MWTGHHGWGVVDTAGSHGLVGDMRRWVVTDGDWMGSVWMENMHGWDVRASGFD